MPVGWYKLHTQPQNVLHPACHCPLLVYSHASRDPATSPLLPGCLVFLTTCEWSCTTHSPERGLLQTWPHSVHAIKHRLHGPPRVTQDVNPTTELGNSHRMVLFIVPKCWGRRKQHRTLSEKRYVRAQKTAAHQPTTSTSPPRGWGQGCPQHP